MYIDEIKSPVALVAHDAGSANLMYGWFNEPKELDIRYSLSGPAKELWSSKLDNFKNVNVEEALQDAQVLISGTSYMSRSEHDARSLAIDLGIYNIAVLDHWVNYPARFVRDNTKIMPDEIWVADIEAMKIAQACFDKTPIFIQKNLYLENLVDKIKSHEVTSCKHCNRILYVLEPIRHEWAGKLIPGEFQALDYFFENFRSLGLNEKTEIVLRPHPSDQLGKYDKWLKSKTTWNIVLDSNGPLEQAISEADIVIGCETYALVVAAAANKKVLSSLPPHAPECRLKVEDLVHLRDLVGNKNKV